MSDEWDMPQDYFPSHSLYANSNIRAFRRDPPIRPISEHGWLFPERAPSSWPHGFSRLPGPVLPFMLFEPMVSRPRMIIHQLSSSPMLPGQFNNQSSTGQPNSLLTADKQANFLNKLRKDTYNPSPRRFSRMVGMYYRDQNSARTRFDPRDDDEDSKRCAVCLEDFESGEEVTITPCDHMFHGNLTHGTMPHLSLLPAQKGDSPDSCFLGTRDGVPAMGGGAFRSSEEANLMERRDGIRKDERIYHKHKVKFLSFVPL